MLGPTSSEVRFKQKQIDGDNDAKATGVQRKELLRI